MPFILSDRIIIYFCHIPKCGGTSIYRMIDNTNLHLSFLNGSWHKLNTKWSKTSPQHITNDRILESGLNLLFEDSFAMVRNPLDRFISAFTHNKVGGNIPFWVSLDHFINNLMKSDDNWHFKFDNHFRPATNFIFDNTKIFKLETQKASMVNYLLDKFYMGDRALIYPHAKKRDLSIKSQAFQRRHITNYNVELIKAKLKNYFVKQKEHLNNSQIRKIESYYFEDYQKFNYKLRL